jgi:hypothetical protein
LHVPHAALQARRAWRRNSHLVGSSVSCVTA